MSFKDGLSLDVQKRFVNFDDLSPEEQKEITASFEALVRQEMEPYIKHVTENHKRTLRLIRMYTARLGKLGLVKTRRDGSEDILRAVVVLTHASLEDFLRTVAGLFLPYADEKILDGIPLAGLGGRPEKFFLGKLTKHRGKTVDDVIQESVSQHLNRETYGNIREIDILLKSIGIDSSTYEASFPKIAAMIERRHQIVHRADMVKEDRSKDSRIEPIAASEVLQWSQAVHEFMLILFPHIFSKRIELQLEEKVLNSKALED
ncbi:MAG: HEPN domain-containing protein [Terriglobales bacterium]